MADSPQKHMHGARARVFLASADGTAPTPIGIFNSCSWSVSYTVVPSMILGRYSAAALTTVGVNTVNITCNGYRVVGAGWHKQARLPRVQDLMEQEYIRFVVTDRQTEKTDPSKARIQVIKYVLPAGADSGYSANELATGTVHYVGILADDEDTENEEGVGAATLLPPG